MDSRERWITNTATSISKSGNRPIVGPAHKLVLHCLGKSIAFNHRVDGFLTKELAIEVCDVECVLLKEKKLLVDELTTPKTMINDSSTTITYHAGLECRLVFPLKKLAPVDVGEEMVRFDFRSTVGT